MSDGSLISSHVPVSLMESIHPTIRAPTEHLEVREFSRCPGLTWASLSSSYAAIIWYNLYDRKIYQHPPSLVGKIYQGRLPPPRSAARDGKFLGWFCSLSAARSNLSFSVKGIDGIYTLMCQNAYCLPWLNLSIWISPNYILSQMSCDCLRLLCNTYSWELQ